MAKRVLIIDDDPVLREIAVMLLADAGHDCAVAENGLQGLTVLEGRPVDLVLLDMMMPVMDGVETLGQIKARWPGLPVVVMTAGARTMSMQALLRLAANLGADEVLQKPLRGETLLPLVARLLGLRSEVA
ncbi:MAG: response regulator [Caulobacter sp.]|nr:response regulator [Caulobacter sp.]